jgi:hypothetical protein
VFEPRAARPLLITLLVAFATTFSACAEHEALPPGVIAARVTAEQFRTLRWFEGRWVGIAPDSSLFYEAYRVEDDSTIRSYQFADSATRPPTDSGTIALRNGRVTSGDSETRWVVTAIDSVSVRFASTRQGNSGFEWRRAGLGAWEARLFYDSAGVATERTYRMLARP